MCATTIQNSTRPATNAACTGPETSHPPRASPWNSSASLAANAMNTATRLIHSEPSQSSRPPA
ncbi:MAG: hypothetical protein MPJ04_04720 [Nitrosopumilus sp.]|nr:hypothetical protein [Nitrosopumilus sp.]MDA7954924.1 hypothetical protein [Nitrosopumilus sp.]